MLPVMVSRVGRIATLALLISVIAFAGYQLPADETFARLRSWYPAGADSLAAAPTESQVNFFLVSEFAALLALLDPSVL